MLPEPNSCGLCGKYGPKDHGSCVGVRGMALHDYVAPTDEQRKDRMLIRRLGLTPTTEPSVTTAAERDALPIVFPHEKPTTDTERCEREGLTPDGEALIVDCTIHGQIGRVQAGHHEAERGDALLARHRADTERDERLREAREAATRARTQNPPLGIETWLITLDAEVTRLDAVVSAVRRFHTERPWRQFDGMPLGGTVCNHCRTMWPCSTVIALDGRI